MAIPGSASFLKEFDCVNQTNLGSRWDAWIVRLTQFFDAYGVNDPKRKVNTMLLVGGDDLYAIHETLVDTIEIPDDIDDNNDYLKAVYRLIFILIH